jgi:predicted deacetylase
MYLIRLDDASDHMNTERWDRVERMLDENGVKPMVGVIPLNRDPMLLEFAEDPAFWAKAKSWQEKGWRIALHGYEHLYNSDCAGINPVHGRSEFAGLSLEAQREKIRDGLKILKDKGLSPTAFFAPSHTFDWNTLEALRLESDIRVISDTVANDCYCRRGFTFIPQQAGRVRELPFKVTTICLHPNFTTDPEMDEIEAFLKSHAGQFLDPDTLGPTTRKRSLLDRGYETAYFLKRKLSALLR